MATINLFLDCRRPRKDGCAQVKLSVNHAEGNKPIPLGIHILPCQWDAEARQVSSVHPLHSRLNLTLRRLKLTADEALIGCGRMSLADTMTTLRAALFPEQAPRAPRKLSLVLEAVRAFAALKSERSTRLTYERTAAHIERFRPAARLEQVSRTWLTEFDAHMAEAGLAPNSRAMMMRNLRAVFNYAIDEGLTSNYPFRKYKIKSVPTAKRNLPADKLRELLTFEVEDWQRPYLDFFRLSFFLIGTNAKDILHLPAGADAGGRIVFNRAKTKRLYSIRIEPEAAEVINRMRGRDHLLDIMDVRSDYMQFIRQCNHALQLVGTHSRKGRKPEGEPLCPGITTYWARHSWATIAASLDIPKETIAAALGHGGHSVTDIYIDFDQRKVDEANRRVIDWVLYSKR